MGRQTERKTDKKQTRVQRTGRDRPHRDRPHSEQEGVAEVCFRLAASASPSERCPSQHCLRRQVGVPGVADPIMSPGAGGSLENLHNPPFSSLGGAKGIRGSGVSGLFLSSAPAPRPPLRERPRGKQPWLL